MITSEHLQSKRGALQASLEQLVGQVNRVNGAIAVIDEMLAEATEREQASVNEALDRIQQHHDARLDPVPDWCPSCGEIVSASHICRPPAVRKEMLPVIPEDATEGDVL